MNTCTLIGRVGKDPEVKTFEGGNKVAEFTLATSRKYKNKAGELTEETQWHNLKAWGKTADIVEKYVKKGDKLAIIGEIKYRSWDDKDGNKKYATEISVNQLEMLGEKPKGDSKKAESKPSQESEPDFNKEEDDLPF
jgi:single-strand DNA-binding protein